MGYARYVGRVGALAVALGVGTAVGASAGIAWAEENDSPSVDSNVDSGAPADAGSSEPSGASADAGPSGPSAPADGTPGGGDDPQPGPDAQPPGGGSMPGSNDSLDVGNGVVVSANGEVRDPSAGGQQDEPDEEAEEQDVTEQLDTTGGVELTEHAPSGSGGSVSGGSVSGQSAVTAGGAPQTAVSATQVDLSGEQAESSVSAAAAPVVDADEVVVTLDSVEAPQEPVSAPESTTFVEILSDVLDPLGGTTPDSPVNVPVDWVLAAAARRELGADTPQVSTFGETGEVPNSVMLTTVTATDPDLGAIIIDPLTGKITGTIVPPGDPAALSRKPSYMVIVPPGAGQGTFTISKTTGAFTYTPTAVQRVLAGFSANPEDTVTVTVTATYGTTKVPVVLSVPVDPVSIFKFGEISTGEGALGLAVTNDRAYVTNFDEGTVTVIDTIHGAVIDDIEVSSPLGVVVTPDGKRLYVSSQDTDSVSVIDTASRAVVTTISLGDKDPQLMAISPDGKTVYVTTTVYDGDGFVVSSDITKISTTTNKIIGTVKKVGLVPYNITVSPDGKKIYVISEMESDTEDYRSAVFVFSSTSTTAKQIPYVGDEPEAVAVSRDNKLVYIGDYLSGTISVVNTTTNLVVATIEAEEFSVDEIVVHPSNTMLMVLNYQTQAIDLYDITNNYAYMGSVETNATTDMNFPEARFSPDGQQLYYTSDGQLQFISLVPYNQFPQVGAPSPGVAVVATGAVTGGYGVSDPDDDALSYVLKTGPTKGKVVLNANGTWTYTPTAAARHAASTVGAGSSLTQDSFVVTVSDGRRGIVEQTVVVDISPTNKAPAVSHTVGSPNTTTGNVSVTVSVTDGDRDVLAFSRTDPMFGTVTGTNGKYVYTPTAPARHAAATLNGPKTDTFTVTVDDGHGSIQTRTVTVKISPKNIAPNSTGSIGLPDNGSGVVSGTITPNDGDNDAVTYSHTNTVKGALQINANGTFTYTPTAAAQLAVRTGGTAAKTEKFTITINDGHGGTDTVTLTAQILAAGDHAPTGGVADIPKPPSASTGAVAGKITGVIDADNDKLTYSGTASTAKGKVTVTSTGSFTYTPTVAARHAAAADGVDPALTKDTFTVTVQDGVGGSTTVTVEVDILAKNAAPTSTATASKPNTSTGVVAVTVTATDADKDLPSYSGPLTSTKGGQIVANGNGSFTYTPTAIARYNASVATATSGDKVDTFNVTIDDGHGGVTNQLVTVSISPKGKPNNVATSAGATSYTEQQGPVVVDGGLTLSNLDSPAFSGATATLTAPQTGDSLAFTAPAGSGIAGSYNTTTGVLTLTGTSSVANYQTALRSVTFTSTTDVPSSSKTVGFVVTDGGVPSAVATKTISITSVNDAPTVVTSGGATGYTEQQGLVVVDGAVTVSDPDSPSLSGATATLTAPQTGDSLSFTAPAGSGITGSYNTATGVLTLTGTSSAANYQTALRSIRFTSTADAPVSSKTVAFVVTSGGVLSAAATKTISITAVNDAPTLVGGGGNIAAAPNTPVNIVPTITVADPDGGNLTGATVAITAGRQADADALALVPGTQNGITGSYNTTTGVLTLTGTASVANYQAALRSITFTNTSATPSEAARTVTITVTDGALTSSTLTLTATVRVNQAPVASDNAYSGAEDTAVVGNVLANDTDPNGDALTATLGTAASHGIVNLNSNGSFTYAPYVNFHGTDSFTYTATDGFTTSSTATVALTVTSVDDVLFNFVYGSGSNLWTSDARAALQRAADRISEYFATTSPVTMTYNVTAVSDASLGYLATGGSAFGIPNSPAGFSSGFIQKVTSVNHVDANGSAADANINWNFGYTFSYDDSPAFDESDLQSVAMHEMLHSFGYLSLLDSSLFSTTRTSWLTFDDFIMDQSGAPVIGSDYKFITAYTSNLSGGNGGLYFGGANAVAAYGGLVPLQESSVSHLRNSTFPYSSASAKMMGPILLNGKMIRTISPIELGILKDLGYTVAGGSQTIALVMAAVEGQSAVNDVGQPVLGGADGTVAAVFTADALAPFANVGDGGHDRQRKGGHHGALLTWYLLVEQFRIG